jgi:hypothetical protein
VKLVRQWQELADGLPAGWSDVRVQLRLDDPALLDRGAALLGPLDALGSPDGTLAFRIAADGSGPTPAEAEELLELADGEGLAGTLELEPAAGAERPPRVSLPVAWADALATLPADWSDLLGEVELVALESFDRAALHLAPINPRRDGDRLALRFRCARTTGYGASPQMVRRCLERCDEEQIAGGVHVLRALSDTHLAQTQGPVWQIAGRTV